MVQVREWLEWRWLRHGFTERAGGRSTAYAGNGLGELNVGFTREDEAENVRANRRIALEEVWDGPGEIGLATLRQVHGTAIVRVEGAEGWAGDQPATVEGDGLVTDVPGIALGVQAADCAPVLLVDVRRRAVGAFHAGWRGTVAGMAEAGVARMRKEFGSKVEDLYAAVGPAIGRCCYAVGEEVRGAFADRFSYGDELAERRGEEWHLDLEEANRRQLVAAGLAEERVWTAGLCTGCARVGGRRRFFSHRSESGFTGRAMGLVGVGAYGGLSG